MYVLKLIIVLLTKVLVKGFALHSIFINPYTIELRKCIQISFIPILIYIKHTSDPLLHSPSLKSFPHDR